MERLKMIAQKRKPTGKGGARKLRAQGLVPAICYGPKMRSIAVSCTLKDLTRIMEHGQNVLINLKIRDGMGKKGESDHVVMIRDFQVDPLQGAPIHADLYEVSMKETMTFGVPVRLVGKPEGTKMGGILEQIRREVEVECLPSDIPPHIEIDVSELDIGDSVHVSDVEIGNVKILTEPNLTIATVVPPTVVPEEVVPAEAEAEEAEEGVETPPGEEEKEPEEEE